MTFTLPKLPYAYNSLEPHIDAKTMEIHHTKHHQAYIDNLNKAVQGTAFEKMDVHELLKKINTVPENIRTIVRNHGGGHANHSLFWTIIGPNCEGVPVGNVAEQIVKTFGDFDKFKEQFGGAALKVFGSGWGWLVMKNKELKIITTPNQDSPLMNGETPLLGIDMWEHAFYLLRQNRKQEYVDAFWHVVNWKEVEKNFHAATK
ncbi:superoxide dismutase [Candidatus Woesearchaeota archaeon]|nr:superoxide dismutase [Candidatus Woesearchaeota archaeon]